jgi:hypothetical protein
MATDAAIKQAFYNYGKELAEAMGEGVDPGSDDEIAEAWDEVGDTSMLYDEILEEVADSVEQGLGARYDELNKRLGLRAETRRGWSDGIKGALG